MRAFVLSDLHLPEASRGRYEWPHAIPDADVCLCAGDVTEGVGAAIRWLAKIVRPHMPVILTLGNHEFYGGYLGEYDDAVREGHEHGIEVLHDRVVEIDGQRFVGGTLWTDFDLYRNQFGSMRVAAHKMADYQHIYADLTLEVPIKPQATLELHRRTRAFLEAELQEGDVVLTHHCPSPRSIAAEYDGDPVNPAFTTNLNALIEERRPALWVHGHTHTSFDYELRGTRVVCNPKGYGTENVLRWAPEKGFKHDLVVEILELAPKVKP